jgi:UDP-N-acetylmuramate: L-alanyl-gamma-D-glutamyl-meso-diaminopimelate ligase
MNALMSIATAVALGFAVETCRHGIETFRGNRRRMERLHGEDGWVVYDDFAHHPTAIAAALQAARETHPGHRIIAVVEPRSNTMVRNIFQKELPAALAHADQVLIGDVHRLEKIPVSERLDFALIASELKAKGTDMQHVPTSEIPDALRNLLAGEPTVIIFMSNGSFGNAPQRLVTLLAAGK